MHTLDDEPLLFVTEALGEVIGVALRPTGGDPTAHARARQQAVSAMATMAQAAGADGVIGLRFDTGPDEVVAYGTAVRTEVDEAEDDGSAAPSVVAREPEPNPANSDDDTSPSAADSLGAGSGSPTSFCGGYARPDRPGDQGSPYSG